ncbi:rho GDP-dissociation inhibitor 1-like [Canna indica]|uniref:Rho GDP-dissociation inhibitor 1-like n=1 Tax=Canna indica TaxID=4628 RepID=A0AAQ3KV68_9LILI|nr:rho GDP-dissociation inhibitor 1-like [Canna indica]
MSMAIGALSGSKIMGLEDNRANAEREQSLMANGAEEEKSRDNEHGSEEQRLNREMSEACLYGTEEEEDEDAKGSVDLNSVEENLEPEVKILSLSIISPGRPDIVLQLPVAPNSKGVWFTLKEGSHYRLKFTFFVSNNIVSGLRYTNTVWKTGVKVDRTKEMLGTFSPQLETYTYETPEETTPSGLFARGSYSARTKFVDDDGKCYLEINYTFDIRREWPSTSS